MSDVVEIPEVPPLPLPPMKVNGVQTNVEPTWLDPDTVRLGNQDYRVKGYNAPEIAHIKSGVYVPGQDQSASKNIPKALADAGYNNIVPTGQKSYNREVADIQDRYGNSASTFVVKTGLTEPDSHTSVQDLTARSALNSFSRLAPKLAQQDPAIAAGMKARQDREDRAASLNKPLYIPKIDVFNEQQYAGFKRSIGHQAVQAQEKEIGDIQRHLQEPDLSPDLRASLERRLEIARQTIVAASTTPDFVGGVMVRSDDRNIMNQANDQLTTSFKNGLYDIIKGIGGIAEMAGDKAGWDYISTRSKAGIKQLNLEQAQLPDTLSSFREIDTSKGAWNTIADTTTYVGNLFAGTVPQMSLMLMTGGTGFAGFVAGALPSSALYTGQYYAEQPDDKKNAGLATTMGVASGILDKLGLDLLMGKLGKNMFTAAGHNDLVKALMQNGKAATVQAAEKLIETTAKAELLTLARFGEEFAKKQILSPEIIAKRAAGLAMRVSGEAYTEGAQQYAQMWAESGKWNQDFTYQRGFKDQLSEALVGGAVMGGAIHVGGAALNAAQWHSAMDAKQEYDRVMNEAQRFQAENVYQQKSGGGHADINSLVTSLAGEPVNAPSVKLKDLPSEETFRWGKLLEPGRLLRQLAHTAIPSIVDDNGNFKTNLAYLKAVIGGYGILPGDHASGSFQRQLGEWSGNNLTIQDGTQAFVPNNKDTLASMLKTNVTSANQMVMDAWTNYWSQGLTIPQNTENDYTLQLWKDSLDITRNKMHAAASDAGVPLDLISNSNALFESSKIIPSQLVGNKNLVVDEMVAQGADPKEANLAVTNLISGNKSKASMARDYMAQHGVFNNPNLAHIFESNIFDNIEHAKEQLATSIMRNKYIGKDGEIIGKLLIKAQQAGEFKNDDEFKQTVSEVKAWVDIMNGDFHSLRDFPNLQKISNFLTTATMLASLGKAALSSQVEVAMATLGTPAVLIKKQIDTYFKEYGAEIASDLNKGSSWATSVLGISMMRETADAKLNNKLDRLYEEATSPKTKDSRLKEIETEVSDLHQRLFGRSIFHRAGFAETGFDAANKFEYQDSIGSTSRKMMGRYASLITLRAQTDANRMAVLSVAGDIMGGQLRILSLVDPDIRQNAFNSGRGLTKEQQQALTELQQYGIDVHSTLDMLDKAPQLMPFDYSFTNADVSNSPELKRLQDHVFIALGNFVDARVVNPQPHNTPKIYNDPRWKAITLMGKFMATAHAVILPRLYKQYLLEGNAGMKYSAFATIAGSLVVASLMNTLKDFLSYDEDKDNPFLKTGAKKAQRAVNASGLIGQFEKITDKLSPVIPNSGPKFTNDPVGWGVDKIKDNSPVASWASKAVGGTSELLAGNTEKGVKQLVRATPVIGSFPRLAKDFVSAFKQNER